MSVAPGQSLDFGTIEAMSPGARGLSATRARTVDPDTTDAVDETERYDGNISVSFIDSSEDVPEGYNDAEYQIETSTDDGKTWENVASPTAVEGGTPPAPLPGRFTIPSASDDDFMVRVNATATYMGTGTAEDNPAIMIEGDPVTVCRNRSDGPRCHGGTCGDC